MNDTADPARLGGGQFPALRNVDPFTPGLRKRAGRLRCSTSAIKPANQAVSQVTSLISYDLLVAGTRYSGILASDGRYFWTISYSSGVSQSNALVDADAALVDMGAGAVGSVWRGVSHGAFCYLQNGVNKPQMLYYSTGLKMIQAGVEKPAVASATIANNNTGDDSGNLDPGYYYVRWAFKNSTTGVTSNPSAVSTTYESIGTLRVEVTDDNFVISTITESTQSGVDKLVIYRTRINSALGVDPDLWWDAEVTIDGSGTTAYNQKTSGGLTDESLTTSMLTDIENVRTERDVPPTAKCLESFGMRMWYAGAGTTASPYTGIAGNFIAFSDFDYPEYVAYVDQQSDHYDGTYLPTPGDVMAIKRAGDRLIVLSKDDAFVIISLAPKYTAEESGRGHGCIARDGAASGGLLVYYVSRDGIYAHTGEANENGSIPLTHLILDETWAGLTATYIGNAIAAYHPTKKQVWFFVTETGQTVNNIVLVYQIAGQNSGWSIYDGYRVKAACTARTVHENTTVEYLYTVDASNILYLCDTGDTDGADDVTGAMTSATRSGTMTSSTGNTNITDTAAAFYNSGSKLLGAPVWVWDADGNNVQLTYVASNTATALTVSPVMTGTPAAGWHYAVGGIGYRIITPAVEHIADGYLELTGEGVQAKIDRYAYTGTDTLYCYLLRDGATSITSGDTKHTIALGDATEGNWPQCGFGDDDSKFAAKLQVCIENYDTDRDVRLENLVFKYQIHDARVGSNP